MHAQQFPSDISVALQGLNALSPLKRPRAGPDMDQYYMQANYAQMPVRPARLWLCL